MFEKSTTNIKNKNISGAKTAIASILNITSVKKMFKNKKLQRYKYI